MAKGIELAPLITKIKVDTESFKNDMSKAAILGSTEADKISKSLSTVTNVGASMERTGKALTAGITLPIIGAGIATTKMTVDFESDFAKVSTLLDDNIVDFGEYKNELLDASSDAKVAVDEFSESVYQSISAGVDQTKAIDFTTEAMKLAKGGFTDGASAVDILTTAINAYGLKTEDSTKISDMLITTQNLGKTTVDELAGSMGRIIPTAKGFNVGLSDVTTAMATLTKNGIATAEATTYYNSMLKELGQSGTIADTALRELSGKGFAQLQAEGVPLTDCLAMLKQKADDSGVSLNDMFGSGEAATAALTIMKDNGVEYNEILGQMENSAGATQKAFDEIDATSAEQLKGALNELKNEGIKLGSEFVPVVEKATDILSDMAETFSNLSDEQKENILKWAGIALVAGPVVGILGKGITTTTKLVSGIGGLSKAFGVLGKSTAVTTVAVNGATTAAGVSTTVLGGLTSVCAPLILGVGALSLGVYAFHEQSQLMNRSVLDSKEELSGMEKIMATLSGTEVKTRKEMEELGWVHEEFSDKLSPEFQKAVEESTKKVQDFNIFLSKIGFDEILSQAESDAFNNQVNTMCDEAIKTIKSKKDESQRSLKELFVASDGVVDEGEQKVLEILSRSSDAQIAEVGQLKADILTIKQKAVDEGRAFNEQEIADIEAKQAKIRQIELENLGGTQEEILYAKNEFVARTKNIDAQSAAALLQEKAKARDEEIIQIKASHDTEIELLKANLEGKSAEEEKEIQNQITNLEADKQEKIDIQKELYEQYLQIIEDNNPKLKGAINKYNGEVLSNEDQYSQKMLAKYISHYKGLNKETKSGTYSMYNTLSGSYSDVAIKVDEKTKEVIGFHDRTNNLTAGYSESMANSARKMADKQSASFQQIVTSEGMYVDYTTGAVCTANGIVVGSLNGVAEATDGTKQCIIDINGTPYNIKVHKDGTIDILNEINATADYATRDRTINILVKQDGSIKTPNELSYNEVMYGFSSFKFNGIDNVPYDGYRATLHKNERVLTAEENKVYSNQKESVDYKAIQSIVRSELGNIVLQIGDREAGRAISRLSRKRGV